VTFPEYPVWKRGSEEKLAKQERRMKEVRGFFQAPAKPPLPPSSPAKERDAFLERKPAPFLRTQKQVGRNDPCPCESGKKSRSAAWAVARAEAGHGCDGRGVRNPVGHGKTLRRLFFLDAFRERFSLDPWAAGLGVDDFGTVLPGDFSPVCFSDFKESLESFPAPTWGNRVGEFLKRKPARLGMGRRCYRDVMKGDCILNSL
jgi:hypothetical protein